MDGHQQRRALTAAEQALNALDAGDAVQAAAAASRAMELDQVGLFAALPEVVASAAVEIVEHGSVSPEGWQAIAEVLGPGPLGAFAAERAPR